MSTIGVELYKISNEYDITNILSKFDSNYIFDIINDKLNSISFATSLIEPNIINSFETNFKMMNEYEYVSKERHIRIFFCSNRCMQSVNELLFLPEMCDKPRIQMDLCR